MIDAGIRRRKQPPLMPEEKGQKIALGRRRESKGLNIAWGITGAGHFLAESVAAVQELSQRNRICTFVSRAGEEVLRMYGLYGQLSGISGGGYLEEIILEREEGYSSPRAGRFMVGKFDLLIIAPATGNTVAKIARGIADSLVTNAAALSNKAGVPVYVLPTDIAEAAQTRTPLSIDRELCRRCEPCPPKEECPQQAIGEQIDLKSCDGCGLCVTSCEFGAIGRWALPVQTRELDRANIIKLQRIAGITVLKSPEEIYRLG
jgi:dihydromethanopterin reductase (acceptor)